MPEVSIIIGVHNNLPFTEKCLDSIRGSEVSNETKIKEIIIHDNGSSDRTKEWLLQEQPNRPNWNLLFSDQALGYAKAYNKGIQTASSEYIILLNNDTEVRENWLDLLISYLELSNVYLASPLLQAEYPHGFCWILKRETFRILGLFNESYELGYCEDSDFTNRVQKSGWYFHCATKNQEELEKNWPIKHHGSITTKQNVDYEKILDRNKWKFWHYLNQNLHNIFLIIPRTYSYLIQQCEYIKNTNTNHFLTCCIINNQEVYSKILEENPSILKERNFHYFPTLELNNSLEECLSMGKRFFPNYSHKCITYIEQ